jgi:hypothetical protein
MLTVLDDLMLIHERVLIMDYKHLNDHRIHKELLEIMVNRMDKANQIMMNKLV